MKIKQIIISEISIILGISKIEIQKYLLCNRNDINGQYTLKCFKLAEIVNEKPVLIAQKIKEGLKNEIISEVRIVNSYVNIFLDCQKKMQILLDDILLAKEKYGNNCLMKGKQVYLDWGNFKGKLSLDVNDIINFIAAESLSEIIKICNGNVYKVYKDYRYDILEIINYKNEITNKNYTSKLDKEFIDKIKMNKIIDLEEYNLPPFILSNDNKVYRKNLIELNTIMNNLLENTIDRYILINEKGYRTKCNQLLCSLKELGCERIDKIEYYEVGRGVINNNYLSGNKEIQECLYKKIISSELQYPKNININVIALLVLAISILKYRRGERKVVEFTAEEVSVINLYFVLKNMFSNQKDNIITKNVVAEEFIRYEPLMKYLARYEDIVVKSVEEMDPYYICEYIIKLVDKLNKEFLINDLEEKKYISNSVLYVSFVILENALRLICPSAIRNINEFYIK